MIFLTTDYTDLNNRRYANNDNESYPPQSVFPKGQDRWDVQEDVQGTGAVLHRQQLPREETHLLRLQPTGTRRQVDLAGKATALQRARRAMPALWTQVRLRCDGTAPRAALRPLSGLDHRRAQPAAALSRLPQGGALQSVPEHPADAGEGRRTGY